MRNVCLISTFTLLLCGSRLALGQQPAASFGTEIQPLLAKYCYECHSGDDPSGQLDLKTIRKPEQVDAAFEVWEKAAELLAATKMPPPDEPQPTAAERSLVARWYRGRFVENVVARPGTFKPRRLSAPEYRNTLRSLFGFDLEVAIIEAEQTRVEKSMVLKLLPTDPPGKSGFRNDTHANPLTTVIWDQYSYLTDAALEELFSARRRTSLESQAGPISKDGFSAENAERLVRSFLPQVYRREVSEEKLSRIAAAIHANDNLVEATKKELKVALMSPAFMFRGLLMPVTAARRQPVDDFELAERLSYFIWGDMPDAELFSLAESRQLHKPAVLKAQVTRLLDSPKSVNLAEDFGVQWLGLDQIDEVSNNPPLAIALKSQPIDFLHYLFSENRPLLEIVDSRTTFVSPLTKGFYGPDAKQLAPYRKPKGIEIEAVPNQKITLRQTPSRGGLLTMPGVLAMNRGPVQRGTWMLERILGDHLPDPPANVGQVPPNRGDEKLSFRQRFMQHRADPTCAVCHDKIDPLGFALEAYGSNGRYLSNGQRLNRNSRKNRKNKPQTVSAPDTSGRLPSGESFDDFDGLKRILTTSQRQPVIRNIVRRTMAYALCRKLEYYDRPTVERIVEKLDNDQATYRDLVHQITGSLPFKETYAAGE